MAMTKSEAMVLRAAYTTKEDLGLRDIQEKAELKFRKEGMVMLNDSR